MRYHILLRFISIIFSSFKNNNFIKRENYNGHYTRCFDLLRAWNSLVNVKCQITSCVPNVSISESIQNFSFIFRIVQRSADALRALEFKNTRNNEKDSLTRKLLIFVDLKGSNSCRLQLARLLLRVSEPWTRHAIVLLRRREILLYIYNTSVPLK